MTEAIHVCHSLAEPAERTWTSSVLLSQEGQWKPFLKARPWGAFPRQIIWTAVCLRGENRKASHFRTHLVLTSGSAVILRSRPKHTRETRELRNERVYIVFALMLPRVYFQSEDRTMHSRLLNPHIIRLKLGARSGAHFSPPVLKGPLEEGAGAGGGTAVRPARGSAGPRGRCCWSYGMD